MCQGQAPRVNETSSLLAVSNTKVSVERRGLIIKAVLYAVQVFYSFFIMSAIPSPPIRASLVTVFQASIHDVQRLGHVGSGCRRVYWVSHLRQEQSCYQDRGVPLEKSLTRVWNSY